MPAQTTLVRCFMHWFLATGLLFGISLRARAETCAVTTGSASWNLSTSWYPQSIPNAIGATAIFNGSATANNSAQTANRTLSLDVTQTVGSIVFNNDLSTFTTTISAGTAGTLTFNETGAGPATIFVVNASGTGNNTISAPMILTDSLSASVNHVNANSAAGALNLTGTMSGPGGFTKTGDALATFGTGAKTYQGATVLSGGRMRISVAAQPSATSSFTVNAGGQLDLIASGNYQFGNGPLNLNGAGATSGPFAVFSGAIRPDTSLSVVISNAVVLQSDTVLHVQGAASGSITFPGVVSGPGKLTLTAPNHDANLGTLVLLGANTYSGGTVVDGGIIALGSAAASLGTGDVTVHSANAVFSGSSAKLQIQTGVANAIADTAALTLAGGGVVGVADDGYVELQSGVNEVVSRLVLGGVEQAAGTYGSTASSATFQNNEYFSGPGIITVSKSVAMKLTLNKPNVVISWPTNATGFVLQQAAVLVSTNIAWTNVTTSVVTNGTNNTVTLGATNGNSFFRLKK